MKKFILGISFIAIAGLLAACSPTASVATSAPAVSQVSPAVESKPAAAQSVAGGNAEVSLANFKFSPAELTVKVGTKVTWTNTDSVGHTVTASDGSWDSGNLGQGQSFSILFDKVGTFNYKCTVHPGMVGKIIVTN
jgi:plastocyanin